MLGIGRENHYRLSKHISRLIIDCTIEMYVPHTLTSEVIKKNSLFIAWACFQNVRTIDLYNLSSNCTADQRLCFCQTDSTIPLPKFQALFCDCTAWFVSDLVIIPNCWFSHAQALFVSKHAEYLSRLVGKPTIWFFKKSDTN